MLRPVVASLMVFVSLGLGGCSGEDPGHAHEEARSTGATCPSSSTLTYVNFGQGFMEGYCTRCHGAAVTGAKRQDAPSDINFDTLDDVRRWREDIDAHAAASDSVENTLMPPGAPLPSLEERRQLGQWLACGAP